MCEKIEDCWMSNLIEELEDKILRLAKIIAKIQQERSSNKYLTK